MLLEPLGPRAADNRTLLLEPEPVPMTSRRGVLNVGVERWRYGRQDHRVEQVHLLVEVDGRVRVDDLRAGIREPIDRRAEERAVFGVDRC